MNDFTTFETRLTDALGRYADRVPTDVEPDAIVRTVANASRGRRMIDRRAFGRRTHLLVGIAIVVLASIGGLALFGGRLLQPAPSVIVSPSPGTTSAPTPATSPTPAATPTAAPPAVLSWTDRDIDLQPAVASIWRLGEWFIAVGPESSLDDEEHTDASFIRSMDGQTWESVPAPARGMEVETGTVEDGVLWLVGKLGAPADPKRGIWTTRDGATWQRVAGVEGLDFGPGRVDVISHAQGGWLALARRWINAEAQDGFMLRSADGVVWTREPYPDAGSDVGLVSDGERWLMVTHSLPDDQTPSVDALTSVDGVSWTRHAVADLPLGGVARLSGGATDVTWSPRGFVIVGVRNEGEYPHPLAWWSPDGETWTDARFDTLPGVAGESLLEVVIGYDDGYLASGHRLQDAASFFTSRDGVVWTQVDDLSGEPLSRVNALAASDDTFVAGGEDDAAFVWSAARD
jgi:hypothetical protein